MRDQLGLSWGQLLAIYIGLPLLVAIVLFGMPFEKRPGIRIRNFFRKNNGNGSERFFGGTPTKVPSGLHSR